MTDTTKTTNYTPREVAAIAATTRQQVTLGVLMSLGAHRLHCGLDKDPQGCERPALIFTSRILPFPSGRHAGHAGAEHADRRPLRRLGPLRDPGLRARPMSALWRLGVRPSARCGGELRPSASWSCSRHTGPRVCRGAPVASPPGVTYY